MDKISSQKDSIQQSLVLQPYILSFDHQDRYYKDLFSEIPNYLGKTINCSDIHRKNDNKPGVLWDLNAKMEWIVIVENAIVIQLFCG